MSKECALLHRLANQLPRHRIPFNQKEIPLDGIYLLFEKSENTHSLDRIVRVGTHTGKRQLYSRLCQHFLHKNKDRSIFRKNIGRAILNQRHDSFLSEWQIDLTTRAAKEKHLAKINTVYQAKVEEEVTKYIQKAFSFVVLPVAEKSDRLVMESKIISTLSSCNECQPSKNWLGRYSPVKKIQRSGLWQVNELDKQAATVEELRGLFAGKAI